MKIITIESKEAGTRDADRLARLIFNVLTGTRFYDWGAGSSDQILSRPVPNFLSADFLVNQHTVEVVIPCPTKCMVLVPPSLKRWAGEEVRGRINQQIRSMFREVTKSSTRALEFEVGPESGSPFIVKDQCCETKLSITGNHVGVGELWAWVFLDEFERDFCRHAGGDPILNDVASILINRELLALPVPEEALWADMRWGFTVSENAAAPDSLNSHYVTQKDCALAAPVLSRPFFLTSLNRLARYLYEEWMDGLTRSEWIDERRRSPHNRANDWIQGKEHPSMTVPRDKFTIRPVDRSLVVPGNSDNHDVKECCLICHARIHDTCWALAKSDGNLLQICDACVIQVRGYWISRLHRVKCDDPAPHLRKETLRMISRKMQQLSTVLAVSCGDRRGFIRISGEEKTNAFVKLWGDMPVGHVAQICEWLRTDADVGPQHKMEDWTSHASVEFYDTRC